jgi:hypothetical protein
MKYSSSRKKGSRELDSKYSKSVKMTIMCGEKSKLLIVNVRNAINICTTTVYVTLQMILARIYAVSDKEGISPTPAICSYLFEKKPLMGAE